MKKKSESRVFCSRRHVDRRRVKARRLSLKQEYFDHNPERRVSMTDRRVLADRRKLLPEILNTFGEDAL